MSVAAGDEWTGGPVERVDGPLTDYQAVLAAADRCRPPVGRPAPSGGPADRPASAADAAEQIEPVELAETLSALRLLDGLRSHLDEVERVLIEGARQRRASWSRIASALGLASRQAAEQRWLRLCGNPDRNPTRVRARRIRQRIVDVSFGPQIASLRAEIRAGHGQLGSDPAWDERHPRAVLARRTLELAGSAEPSAMFSLVERAVDDLERMSASDRAAVGTAVLRRLRVALSQATPDRN